MNNLGIPKIGFRNIKTGIAVFICLIIFKLINREDCTFACVASILCMGDSVESSLDLGKERIIGTLFGGISSIAFLYIVNFIPNVGINSPVIIAIGVSFIIYICNVFKCQDSCGVCCMVYISIMLNYAGSGAILYSANRTLDTLIGVIIAIVVNYYIKPPKNKTEDVDFE